MNSRADSERAKESFGSSGADRDLALLSFGLRSPPRAASCKCREQVVPASSGQTAISQKAAVQICSKA